MYSLVNSNFNRTYNPSGRQNALSDIKRLLTSRDTAAQSKACGYLIEVASRYNRNSEESGRMVEYLLDNDITVFLCEATANLDFSLFRSITTCMRLLWRSPRFFSEEHAAHASSAVLRALAHYTGSGPPAALDTCLHFLCDLLNWITNYKTTPPLSHQSAYSAVQLLACLNSLAPQISTKPGTILSSALVLEALVSYQPDDLYINSSTAKALVPVLSSWVSLTLSALQHAGLTDDGASRGVGATGGVGATRGVGATGGVGATEGMGAIGSLYVVVCTLGLHIMGLIKLFHLGNKKANFVQAILADEQEVNLLEQCSAELAGSAQRAITGLVIFTKEHQNQISSEEYGVFLNFLLRFFYESNKEVMPAFCDMLCAKGYLSMLPQAQIARNDATIRKASTLVLGELLKGLADNYLNVSDTETEGICANDIHMGLVELQYGIERPQSLGMQLQKGQPYSLLVYIYFYCQSSDNPEEATAPLLPFLVEHILKLPKSFRPPPYIIKALWLVFAMSTISNESLDSLEERVYLEKASERLVAMLQPEPSLYYTHNPGILLWAFTSQRIPNYVKFHVMSEWLKLETSLPSELTTDPTVWELLLNVLVQSDDRTVVEHCMECLQVCVEDGDDDIREDFTTLVWVMLPNVLSKALIDDGELAPNICYLLDLATTLLPSELDPTLCLKTAVLITAVFSKNIADAEDKNQNKSHFEYVCLKLCLYLLGLANNQNDNRVLITYVNRAGFLPSVLSSSASPHEGVACAALQLLSSVVYYFTKNNYQPKSVLQIQTQLIIQSFRRDSNSERGASLLQLVYLVLNSGVNTPLALAYDLDEAPVPDRQCSALRCLMFRIQLMLCSRESTNQSSGGWKTLNSIFKHAIVTRNDTKLVATLTSQPWTFTLVQFQISQPITEEFLTFLHNWITLLKITIKKNQEQRRSQLGKYGLVTRTMVMLKKNLKDKEQKELVQKIVAIVKEILMESSVMGRKKC